MKYYFKLAIWGEGIEQVAFSPNGKLLAACNHAGALIFLDSDQGKELLRLDDYTDGSCALDFYPDGNSLALGFFKNGTGWYQFVNLPDIDQVFDPDLEPSSPADWKGAHLGATTSLDLSPDGILLAGTTGVGEFILWNSEGEDQGKSSGGVVARQEAADGGSVLIRPLSNNFTYAGFSPDGSHIITTGIDGIADIWGVEDRKIVRSLSGHLGEIIKAAFSPDGSLVATGSTDRTTRVWDVNSGHLLLTLTGHTGAVTDLAFSPDGSYLYTAGADGTIRTYVLGVDEFIALAQSRVTRSLTTEECQTYLHLDECPKE